MSRRFLRVTFAALALFMAVAGSLSVRRANAYSCDDAACHAGSEICAYIFNPDGTMEACYGGE